MAKIPPSWNDVFPYPSDPPYRSVKPSWFDYALGYMIVFGCPLLGVLLLLWKFVSSLFEGSPQ